MRTMKKSKMICAAVLTGVLGAAALAGAPKRWPTPVPPTIPGSRRS